MKMPSENPFRLIESLKSLGLTKYEALVYIALLRVTSATATEIHGSSGVPRASVYPVIDQLLHKDLVSVSQSIPKRFAAVPPEEAIARLRTHVDRDADYALENLSAIHTSRMKAEQGSEELIWNIHGRESIQKSSSISFPVQKRISGFLPTPVSFLMISDRHSLLPRTQSLSRLSRPNGKDRHRKT